jgi:hypothetical protein
MAITVTARAFKREPRGLEFIVVGADGLAAHAEAWARRRKLLPPDGLS